MQTLQNIKEHLLQLKPILIQKYSVSTLGIFGSYARNEATNESDIDVLIDFSKPIGIEFLDIADLLEKKLRHKVDLVSRNGIKDKYFASIKNDLIYV